MVHRQPPGKPASRIFLTVNLEPIFPLFEWPGDMKAHKAILSTLSPVFSVILHSNMKEKDMDQIPIPEIDSDIFYSLIRFLYTEQVELMESNAELLLSVADQYLVPSLKSRC